MVDVGQGVGTLLLMECCAEGKNLLIAQRVAVILNANEELVFSILKGQFHHRALRRNTMLNDVFNQRLKDQYGHDVRRQGFG